MKICRVFPTRTNMSPTDEDAYFGPPEMFMPTYDEVHISTIFTWDKDKALELKYQWEAVCPIVKVGGPAFDDPGGEFEPGLYLKPGVTITSRGCPCKHSYCFVPRREGKIRELAIKPGRIIQDNNLLACSKEHLNKVFAMLKGQKAIDFAGGFEAGRVTPWIVEQLRGLSVYQIWLAYDYAAAEKPLMRAVELLKPYFRRDSLRCYVLIGFGDDTIEKAEVRLRRAWEIGTLPFPMLYKPKEYAYEWHRFQNIWSRPAIVKSLCSNKISVKEAEVKLL